MAYAVAYIQSEASQQGVLLKVGSDDKSKVYLNGKLVYQCMEPRGYRVDQDVVAGPELKAELMCWCSSWSTNSWTGRDRYASLTATASLCQASG